MGQPEPKSQPSRVVGICVLLAALCEGGPMELPDTHWAAHVARLKAERHAKWLTPADLAIGMAIANFAALGDAEPTVAQIAEVSDYAERTVRRARARLRERGLLEVQPQFEVTGGQAWQVASRNVLLVPDTPLTRKPTVSRGRTFLPPKNSKKENKEALNGFGAVLAARAELARIAQRRMIALGFG